MHRTKPAKQARVNRETIGRKKTTADHDLVSLAAQSKAHDWLRSDDEDIYTPKDGRPASWPTRPTNEAA